MSRIGTGIVKSKVTGLFMEKYKKPIVWDEICYEGNLELGWGNITGQELVRRFWEGALRGGHCGPSFGANILQIVT